MPHYDEHARDEAALRGALWFSGGALFLLRQLPARLSFTTQSGNLVPFSTAISGERSERSQAAEAMGAEEEATLLV